jgi:hypothetical protein
VVQDALDRAAAYDRYVRAVRDREDGARLTGAGGV